VKKHSLFAVVVLATSAAACGGAKDPRPAVQGGSKDPSKWPADDRTMCEWRGKSDVEVAETAGPGALRPNVRRVYRQVGDDGKRRVLACREIDTNLDGVKDIVRTFNVKGEADREEADTNYDGKVDTWASFVGGRLSEVREDENKDGRIDVWKYYVDGNLSRIKRDRNFDGKPDVWEVYTRGHLERMGVDETFDGHVDRWDRDSAAVAEAEEAERRAKAAMEAARADGGAPH